MTGMVVGGKDFLKFFERVILGHDNWQLDLMDYYDRGLHELLDAVYPASGMLGTPVSITPSGAADFVFDVDAGNYAATMNGCIGAFAHTADGMQDVPYKNGAVRYVGVKVDAYPTEVDTGTSGVRDFKTWATAVGRSAMCTNANIGVGTMTLTTDLDAWENGTKTRPCVAWLIDPETDSSEAIYTGVAELVGGAIKVNVTHQFGQTAPSVVGAKYKVFVFGPQVDAAPLSAAEYALWGQIDAAGAVTYAEQNLLDRDPILVGDAPGTHFDTLKEAVDFVGGLATTVPDRHRLIRVVGPTTETTAIVLPCSHIRIESMRGDADVAVQWSGDNECIDLNGKSDIAIRNLRFKNTDGGNAPVGQTRVVFKGAATNSLFENLRATATTDLNGFFDGSWQYGTMKNIDADQLADFLLSLSGPIESRFQKMKGEFTGADSGGAVLDGIKIPGGARDSVFDDIQIGKQDAGHGGNGPSGMGINISVASDRYMFNNIRVYEAQDTGLDVAAGCSHCQFTNLHIEGGAGVNASTGIRVEGTNCKFENIYAEALNGGAGVTTIGFWVNKAGATYTQINNLETETGTGLVADNGLQIDAGPSFCCVCNLQTRNHGLNNLDGANSTVVGNRDDA